LEAARGGDLTASEFRLKYGQSKSEAIAQAAADLQISYSVLFRLIHGQQSTMSWKVESQLRKAAGDDWSILERFLLSSHDRRMRREYQALLLREITRYEQRRRERDIVFFLPAEARERESFARQAQLLGFPAPRQRLAELRVFDPIIAWRRLRENMSNQERLLLVRLGFKRERELLKLEHRHLTRLNA
jgi:hypothetical protein